MSPHDVQRIFGGQLRARGENPKPKAPLTGPHYPSTLRARLSRWLRRLFERRS